MPIAQSQSQQREMTTVYTHEDYAWLLVKERMEDAMRFAAQRRAIRAARRARPAARIRLGMALVRLGHWIMGSPYTQNGECGMRIAE
jgi:hypothetical protein